LYNNDKPQISPQFQKVSSTTKNDPKSSQVQITLFLKFFFSKCYSTERRGALLATLYVPVSIPKGWENISDKQVLSFCTEAHTFKDKFQVQYLFPLTQSQTIHLAEKETDKKMASKSRS
jgi:hypothetical protein